MHLVYNHLPFFGHVPRGLVKLPQVFSLSSDLLAIICGVAD